MQELIEISGDYLESGGQICRTAISLSAITKRPCHVFNIRKGRKEPGLKLQHLMGIKAVAELCNGKLENAKLGSTEIWFYPEKLEAKNLKIKIETAGSIALCLQSLMIPAANTERNVEIVFEGGATDTHFAPTLGYFENVLFPIIQKMNYRVDIEIKKRGYYPAGGSKVIVNIYPTKQPKSIELIKTGKLLKIYGLSHASKFLEKAKVAERQAKTAQEFLKSKIPIEIAVKYFDTLCSGSGIDLFAVFENSILGANSLGELGKPAEKIGEDCAKFLMKQIDSNACLDEHMADQILIYMALASSSEISVAEITNHCKTTMWVIEKFLPVKFKINEKERIIKLF
jgi:RNA 3'-phosphate cyclase